jgi:hypothetical protein
MGCVCSWTLNGFPLNWTWMLIHYQVYAELTLTAGVNFFRIDGRCELIDQIPNC